MASVYIATPTTRDLSPDFTVSLFQTTFPGKLIWKPLRNQPVDYARNFLADKFLIDENEPEAILFADSDATWHPKAVERLFDRNLPVVTGVIYRRKLPPFPTLGMYLGKNEKGNHTYEFKTGTQIVVQYARDHGLDDGNNVANELCLDTCEKDLFEIDGAGLHFMMIRREVLEAIQMPWFRCTHPGAGEDFYFSRKVKEAGYKIYADLSVHTGHIAGPGNDFGINELLSMLRLVPVDQIFATEDGNWDMGK